MGSGSATFSSNWSLIIRSRNSFIVGYLQFSLSPLGEGWGGGLGASTPSPLTPLPVGEGKEKTLLAATLIHSSNAYPRVLQRATDVVSILPAQAQSRNCRGARWPGQSGPLK